MKFEKWKEASTAIYNGMLEVTSENCHKVGFSSMQDSYLVCMPGICSLLHLGI